MSIADRAREAEGAFESWRTSFEPGSPQVEEAENQLFRFNLWTSNNFIFGAERASMDWRLRNAAVLHSAMEDLLNDLKDNLIGHHPRSLEDHESTKPGIIEENLDELFRFSRAVRRSGVLHRFVKIANYIELSPEGVNLTEQFRNAATQLVGHYLRNSPAAPSLRDRLIETICIRQQNFSYLKSRRIRMPLAPRATNAGAPSASRSVLTTSFSVGGTMSAAPKRKKNTKVEPPRQMENSVMTATTVQYNNANVQYSVQSSVNDHDSEKTDSDANLASPPVVPIGQKEWECPYCLLVCPVKEFKGEAWRKHILGDVMPYICILDNCLTPNTLFKSSKDWILHMKKEHVSHGYWTCMDSVHDTPCLFKIEHEFKSHMHRFHGDQFDDSELEDLTEACFESKPSNFSLSACPFCDANDQSTWPTDDMLSHVSHHLLSFARISLEGYVEEQVETSNISSLLDETDSSHSPLMAMTVKQGLEMHIDAFTQNEDDDSESLDTLSELDIPQDTENESWEFYWSGKEITHYDPTTDPVLRSLMRNAKNVKFDDRSMRADWASFHKVSQEVINSQPKKELVRQEMLQEIVVTELSYSRQLKVVQDLYKDQLINAEPPIVHAECLKNFAERGFDHIDLIERINREHLLERLLDRRRRQGPFIVGCGDIFCDWATVASKAYVAYSTAYPCLNFLFRDEATSNSRFGEFLRQARDNKRSNRLAWDTFLKSPIQRISQYVLLLRAIHKKTQESSAEMSDLTLAIHQLEVLQKDCGDAFEKSQKNMEVTDLISRLHVPRDIISDSQFDILDLNLEIIYEGDLQKKSTRSTKLSLARLTKDLVRPSQGGLIDTHGVLFNTHFVLMETTTESKESRRFSFFDKSAPIVPRKRSYKVSEVPIPMQMLALEVDMETRQAHSIARAPKLRNPEYPMRIRNLETNESFSLFAFSQSQQDIWKKKITEAQTRHAALLVSLHNEPFRLNFLSESTFQYASSPSNVRIAVVPGAPLDQAMKKANVRALQQSRLSNSPPYLANVNCVTVMFQSEINPTLFIVGTDDGAFIFGTRIESQEGIKMLPGCRVTQIHGLEQARTLVLLADNQIFVHELHPSGIPFQLLHPSVVANYEKKIAPKQVSGRDRVHLLVACHYNGRPLLIYLDDMQRPKRLRMIWPTHREPGTLINEFIPRWDWSHSVSELDCDDLIVYDDLTRIDIDNTTGLLVLMTSQRIGRVGFHLSSVDNPWGEEPGILWSVDDFDLHTVLDRQEDFLLPGFTEQYPNRREMLDRLEAHSVGTFVLTDTQSRLAGNHYVAVYERFAFYLTLDLELSSKPFIWFRSNVKKACLDRESLILFHEEYIEVRDVLSGKLSQVIPACGVKCLSDKSYVHNIQKSSSPPSENNLDQRSKDQSEGLEESGNTVKISMQHPENANLQSILELIRNPEAQQKE